MKLRPVQRLASMLAVLVLLLGQAWAGSTARLTPRPCCCKPGEAAHSSVARAKCCGQSERSRAATQVVVRAPAQTDTLLLAVLPPAFLDGAAVSISIDVHPASQRLPEHGIGRGLPYRLRV